MLEARRAREVPQAVAIGVRALPPTLTTFAPSKSLVCSTSSPCPSDAISPFLPGKAANAPGGGGQSHSNHSVRTMRALTASH